MSTIEKYISPFIDQQFPDFYIQEGPNFVAFVKAYYEWLEQSNSTIGHARSLLSYADIDTTREEFIEYFKRQYVINLPRDIAADKSLLIKHITDLYRAKGTKRAYELLFRLVFDEDIELYLPSEFIFKPSDNTWKVPRYIEVTSNPKLSLLPGVEIRNIGNTAIGIVESYDRKLINGRTVNILELSSIRGEFRYGDSIIPVRDNIFLGTNLPIITGSLTAIAIDNGGFNYSVGDILDVSGSGIGAKARVSSVSNNFIGSVAFLIAKGGSGYTINSIVTVSTTVNIPITNLNGQFSLGEKVLDTGTNANGIIVGANSSFLQLIDFTSANSFIVGNSLTGQSSGANATVLRVIGGTGQGATFRVGSITNKELIGLSSEVISPSLSIELDGSSNTFLLGISNTSGSFNIGDTITGAANVVILEVDLVTSNSVLTGESLSNASLGISGLYAYKSDQNLIWITGSDTVLLNANLVAGSVLISNTTSTIVQLINTPSKETVSGTATIDSANSTALNVSIANGYFVTTSTITNSNTAATALLTNLTRLTDWNFANSSAIIDNLDAIISEVTPYTTFEIGTIDSLTAINPGSGYLTNPFVTVVEPLIVSSNLFDVDGTQKGNNAIIDTRVIAGNGVISTVEIIDSGFGYLDNETLSLRSSNNEFSAVGSSIVFSTGKSIGRWLNRKSFPSDLMKIYDGLFYQDYAYEIISSKMLESYESLVRNMVHPAGIALYGRYRVNRLISDDQDVMVESSINQQ